jgi:hypothetical protein
MELVQNWSPEEVTTLIENTCGLFARDACVKANTTELYKSKNLNEEYTSISENRNESDSQAAQNPSNAPLRATEQRAENRGTSTVLMMQFWVVAISQPIYR